MVDGITTVLLSPQALHWLTPHAWLQGEALEAAEAARIFEGQLAGALVAEDGQLALSTLAASAAHGFMPRIQTQGQLGQARWRFVSAPSIPGAPRPPARGTAPADHACTDGGGGTPNICRCMSEQWYASWTW